MKTEHFNPRKPIDRLHTPLLLYLAIFHSTVLCFPSLAAKKKLQKLYLSSLFYIKSKRGSRLLLKKKQTCSAIERGNNNTMWKRYAWNGKMLTYNVT